MKHKITQLTLTTLFATATVVPAATFTWTGATGNRWDDSGNWSEGALVSANTTDVIISGTTNIGMAMGNVNYTIRSLTYDATNDGGTALQLSQTGNSNGGVRHLTFSSDSGNATLTVDADSTGNKSIIRNTVTDPAKLGSIILASSLDVVHNGSGILTLGNGDQVTNYGAKITGSGGINKSGSGTLRLSGANDYTGDTTVNEGILSLNQVNALQNSTLDTGTSGGQSVTFDVAGNNTYNIGGLKGADALDIGANTISVGSNDQSTSYTGILSGTGGSLTKVGTGTLTLTGTNTYTGDTTISVGTLQISGGGSLSTSSAVVNNANLIYGTTIASDTYGLSSSTTGTGNLTGTAELIQLNGDITQGTVNLTSGTSGALYQRGIELVSDTTITAGSITLTGDLGHRNSSTDNLTLDTSATNGAINLDVSIGRSGDWYGFTSFTANAGTGTLTVSGTNAESGGWRGPSGASLTGALNITSSFDVVGNLNLTASGNSSVTGNLVLGDTTTNTWTVDPGLTMTVSGNVSGTGAAITKAGTGTLTLSGANTYTGDTRIEAGTVEIQNSAALGTGLVNLVDTGTQVLDFGADGLTLANNVQISNQAGTKTIRLDSGGAGHTGTLSGQLDIRRDTAGEFVVDVGNTDELLVTSAIVTNLGGGAGLTKEGDGLLRIEANSTYSGGTVINGGTLRIRNVYGSRAWSPGTININNGSALEFTGDGSQTIMQGAGDSITIDSNGGASISLTSNLIWRSAGVITTGGSQSTFSGAAFNGQNNLGNRVYYTVAEGTDDIDLLVSTSHNSGTGITKNGAGTLGLTSTSNATVNTININDGTLEISGSGRLNSGNYGASITNAGIFRYNSTNDQSLNGIISGAGSLEKDNSSTLTLTGVNTYSGNTSVSGGTLVLSAADNNIASSVAIDVASGATLDVSGITNGFALASGQTLSGSGTVTGAMTIASGSVLSPGNSPGTLSTGSQVWNTGGTYLWEINDSDGSKGLTGGGSNGWDWLDITGTLDLTSLATGGFTIDIDSLTSLDLAGTADGFDTYTKGDGFADYTFIIASFDTLKDNYFDASLFTLDTSGFSNAPQWDWSIALSGNDLVLEAYAVPEPSSAALLGLGGLALALRRKRS